MLILNKGLVGIAIEPAFARLGGSDYGVPGGASMLAGMLMRGTVAAQGHSAFLARPQMHPACGDFHTLTAFKTRRVFYFGNPRQVCTAFVNH